MILARLLMSVGNIQQREDEMAFRLVMPLAASSLLLSACAYRPMDVADPDTITLRSAVIDVADTLAAARAHTAGRAKSGLLIDEATVVFNVSAKSNETTGLQLDTSLPPAAGFPLALSSSYTLANEGNRGNQITLKFKNIATAKVGTGPLEQIARCGRPNPPDWCNVILNQPGPRR